MLNPIEKRKIVLSALSNIYEMVVDRTNVSEHIVDDYLGKSKDISNDSDTADYYKEQAERTAIKIKTYNDILDKLKDMAEDVDID